MQKLVELKQRIDTVSNIQTVTRTLAAVSAAKLSRTRRKAAAMRVYAAKMREVVLNQQREMARNGTALEELSPLAAERAGVGRVALLVVAGDRGMCGNYNIAVSRLARAFISARRREGKSVYLLAKGRKAARYLRADKQWIVHSEGWSREGVADADVTRLLGIAGSLFTRGEVDEVHAAYTRFYSPIKREPSIVRILPLRKDAWKPREGAEESPEEAPAEGWCYEPSFEELMEELIWTYLRLLLFDILIESYASEQGARMITMEEATERAEKSLHEYRVMHNRLRREVITTDLIGVLFAAQVLEKADADAKELV